jgi:primary-amine oxidase
MVAGQTTHMHGPIWRLDLDLNGACCDAVARFRHSEVGNTGVDTHTDVTVEGGRTWSSPSFTMFAVRDQSLKNANGKSSHWHLVPTVSGTPVHQEPFTKYTAWITRYRWNEMAGSAIPTYAANAESVLNRDIVLWYYGGLHHLVRDEDTDMIPLMWTGFMLMPFNVFASTPLHP